MQEGKVQTLTGCIAYTGGTATCCECILAIQGTLKPLCCSVELTMNTEQHRAAQPSTVVAGSKTFRVSFPEKDRTPSKVVSQGNSGQLAEGSEECSVLFIESSR